MSSLKLIVELNLMYIYQEIIIQMTSPPWALHASLISTLSASRLIVSGAFKAPEISTINSSRIPIIKFVRLRFASFVTSSKGFICSLIVKRRAVIDLSSTTMHFSPTFSLFPDFNPTCEGLFLRSQSEIILIKFVIKP